MALTLNGTTSKLIKATGITVPARPRSIFCWIKPATNNNFYQAFSTYPSGTLTFDGILVYNNATVTAWSHIGSTSGFAIAATPTDTNAWQPCLAVFNGASLRKIYYGAGAVQTDMTTVSDAGHDSILVGCHPDGISYFYAGDIAELAIWSSDVSANWSTLQGGALPETVAAGTLYDSWSLLTQAATQTGTNGIVLTATSTSQAASHPIARGAATAVTLSGPTSGGVNVASTNFTAGANGTITGTVTVTPTDSSGNGSFTPTTVSISSGTPTATFTYTPTTTGNRNINATNNGSLTAPSNIVYNSIGQTISVTVVTSPIDLTPRTGLSGLKWAWFDNPTPNNFVAPTDKGAAGSTDGAGLLSLTLVNTTKTSGQVGWLIFSNSDGTVGQTPVEIAFSGPVAVN